MKIELILTDSINEKCNGMSCFDSMFEHQRKAISDCKRVQGICIINEETYKFSFSPYFMDGDVFTTESSIKRKYYSLVKTVVVEYVYVNRDSLSKTNERVNAHKEKVKELIKLRELDHNENSFLDAMIKNEKKFIKQS